MAAGGHIQTVPSSDLVATVSKARRDLAISPNASPIFGCRKHPDAGWKTANQDFASIRRNCRAGWTGAFRERRGSRSKASCR